jgi:hypothetical protein
MTDRLRLPWRDGREETEQAVGMAAKGLGALCVPEKVAETAW